MQEDHLSTNGNRLVCFEVDGQTSPGSWLDSVLGTVIAFVMELDLAHLAAAEYAELTTYLPRDAAANTVSHLYRS